MGLMENMLRKVEVVNDEVVRRNGEAVREIDTFKGIVGDLERKL